MDIAKPGRVHVTQDGVRVRVSDHFEKQLGPRGVVTDADTIAERIGTGDVDPTPRVDPSFMNSPENRITFRLRDGKRDLDVVCSAGGSSGENAFTLITPKPFTRKT